MTSTEQMITVTLRVHRFAPQAQTAPQAQEAKQPDAPQRRRRHSSPFARLDAKRAHGGDGTDGANRSFASARRREHVSPFARLDAQKGASRAAATDASPTPAPRATENASAAVSIDQFPYLMPTHRRAPRHAHALTSRRAASTLGGAPVAGGFAGSNGGRAWIQEYTLVANPQTSLLDCLLRIKREQDPTLAFRYSCGHGMCGSDAVAINGTPSLLCKTTVAQAAASAKTDSGFRHTVPSEASAPSQARSSAATEDNALPDSVTIDLAPIAGFEQKRDLIADIEPMLDQIRALAPYLEARGDLARTADGKINVFEYLQSPEQLAKYEQLTTCIACGACEASCPVFVGGDAFVGPAALVNQIRFVEDSRDGKSADRMKALGESDGLSACQSVRACGLNCPQGIDVGEVIWQFIQRTQTMQQEG
ncbi:MAG: 2Fe-2S iron-sulfur cluster-binding protein [Bifidobacteriaceae bacterium]|nr:2Fe-2S iron-sulfur cluster-binding protein [Bifidobacteriaceae bacterium]